MGHICPPAQDPINPAALGVSLRRSGLGHDVDADIGIAGSAAVANAIHHATGKRVRKTPITLLCG
ncbi:hypothetical protein [Deinococcus saxicola]|uniref:hypothetical protein n=1 Tax=Deinococcus saxicola TaxID=249406 RepID=UPI0039F1176A